MPGSSPTGVTRMAAPLLSLPGVMRASKSAPVLLAYRMERVRVE